MPKDHVKVQRSKAPTLPRLSPEALAAFRPHLPDSRHFLALQERVRLAALRRDIETARQELEAHETTVLRALAEHKVKAAREIAALEDQLREAEEQCGIARPVTPAPTPAERRGAQTALVRQFFEDTFDGGWPPETMGHGRLHEQMGKWVVKKNAADGGNRRAVSVGTIRNVRKKRL